MTILFRDSDGNLSTDFTRAVARRAQVLATRRHTVALACYSAAMIETRQAQPDLWAAHEAFRQANTGDEGQLDGAQVHQWERFTAADERARQQAERFAAEDAHVPPHVLSFIAATDGMNDDDLGALYALTVSVLHPSTIAQAQTPTASPAVADLVAALDGWTESELNLLDCYLGACLFVNRSTPLDTPEEKAVREIAGQRRLAARIDAVQSAIGVS